MLETGWGVVDSVAFAVPDKALGDAVGEPQGDWLACLLHEFSRLTYSNECSKVNDHKHTHCNTPREGYDVARTHRAQDVIDDANQANVGYKAEWHPILAAVEIEPGVWHMTAQYGGVYAVVRALELGGERGYRVVTWAERSDDRELIGYYRTLRRACEAGYGRYVRSVAPKFQGYPKLG